MGATGRLRGGLVILIGVSVATALGVAYLHLSGREGVKPEARTARQSAPSERTRVYVGAARRALGALQDVQSLVHQGITLPEYQRRIADARISVDRFLRAHPTDLAPPSQEDIRAVIRCYEAVAPAWNTKIRAEVYGRTKLASQVEATMQDVWLDADLCITEAETALYRAGDAGRTHLEVGSHLTVFPDGQLSQALELLATGELYRLRDMDRWKIETLLARLDLSKQMLGTPRPREADRAFAVASIILSKLYLPDLAVIARQSSREIEVAAKQYIEVVAKQARAGGWSFRRSAEEGQVAWRATRRFSSLDGFREEEVSRFSRFIGHRAAETERPTFWDSAAPLYGDVRLRARNFFILRYYAWEETIPAAQTQLWAKNRRLDRAIASAMFPTRYRVTLPGVITSTNGRATHGTTAEWYYPSLFDFERGQTLRVASRYVDWYALGGGVIGVVGVSAGWLWRRRRRPKPPPLAT